MGKALADAPYGSVGGLAAFFQLLLEEFPKLWRRFKFLQPRGDPRFLLVMHDRPLRTDGFGGKSANMGGKLKSK